MSRLVGPAGMPVRGELLHQAIDNCERSMPELNLTERALLGAVELVAAAKKREATLEDAVELLRDVWSGGIS